MMQIALASTDVAVVDGATTHLPLASHRAAAGAALTAEQRIDNEHAVRDAWHLHALNVRRALAMGIEAAWDFHPAAQLPARYGALFAFYLEARAAMTARLARFVEEASRATRQGQAFDDAATGQGLLVFFLRGLSRAGRSTRPTSPRRASRATSSRRGPSRASRPSARVAETSTVRRAANAGEEADHLLELYGGDATRVVTRLEQQLSLVASRAQMLLQLAGLTITVTGFSGANIARSGRLAAILVVSGLVVVLVAASLSMGGILRVQGLRPSSPPAPRARPSSRSSRSATRRPAPSGDRSR